ncbi:MAG: hypothetical protein JSS91_08490 [Bacteroidetes bacterium]|nr:hypothetical protein [Bacteroidota bacterium]
MTYRKLLTFLFSLLLTVFISGSLTIAQEIPDGNKEDSQVFIDTIETSENLLDSNEVYKKEFEKLSEDGDWIKVKKSDFIKDLSSETGEDLDSYYMDNGGFIYVWRPYCATPSWNPYYNGSWVFSYYGWVWSSSYSWGWGPYNYGRWYYSNFYGWIWLPGNVWAANWVTWRNCGGYYAWYPTCPRVYWRGHNHRWHHNNLYTYKTKNWVIVKKSDFTKIIDEKTVEDPMDNINILKNSKKMSVTDYSDKETKNFKHTGPDAVQLTKESGKKITPEYVDIKTPVNSGKNDGLNSTSIKNNGQKSTRNDQTAPNNGNVKVDRKKDVNTKTNDSPDVNKKSTPESKDGNYQKPADKNNQSNKGKVKNDNSKNSGSKKNYNDGNFGEQEKVKEQSGSPENGGNENSRGGNEDNKNSRK